MARPKLRILVVDDQKLLAAVHTKLLQQMGHLAQYTTDPLEGLKTAESEDFDIILSDLEMPKMDGYLLAKEVRSRSKLAHLRLIAVTGFELEEAREKALQAGYDAILQKPLDLTILEQRLQCSHST